MESGESKVDGITPRRSSREQRANTSESRWRLARKRAGREKGNLDGTEETGGSIRGRGSGILKMPPSEAAAFARAKEFISCARKRRDAASLQKHAINYPGIAASTIPSMLYK